MADDNEKVNDPNHLYSDEANGIDYVIAQRCHRTEAVKLLAKSFAEHEPLTVAVGGTE